jgi:hypothetical protein
VAAFLIVTSRDLPEAYFLAAFLTSRDQRTAILNMTTRPLGNRVRVLARLARRRGLRYLGDLALGRLVGGLARRPVVDPFPELGRGRSWRAAMAARLDCRDLHAPVALGFVRSFAPDWILLAGAPVIRRDLYGLARHGALNRHLGLLPRFRGSDCPLWALALDDPEGLGFGVHFVSDVVDHGDVILQERMPVEAGASFEDYLARLQRRASEAFAGVVERICRSERLTGTPPPPSATYFPPAPFSIVRRARANFARLAHAPGAAAALGRL